MVFGIVINVLVQGSGFAILFNFHQHIGYRKMFTALQTTEQDKGLLVILKDDVRYYPEKSKAV
jgi:hypothetical protein